MEFSFYFPIWNQLDDAQKKLLQQSAVFRQVRKGTVIHNGSENCTGLLLLGSGQLRAYILSDEGREITIYRLLAHDICLFSASCIMNSIQFEISVEAEKDTAFWIIPADIYKKLMLESAAVSNYTNEVMATRFSDVMWLMEQVLWKSFDKRLAEFLLEESNLDGSLVLKTTHEAIGNHLGNPREVVTRMLRYFQSEGMVRLARGVIEITDKGKLESLV